MSNAPYIPPVNPLPPVVIVLSLALFGVEIVLSLAGAGYIGGASGIGWRLSALETFGLPGGLLTWMVENSYYDLSYLRRFLTYPFVHINFTHTIFVAVFTLALGKMVGEAFRAWAVLVVFFGAAITGAVAYGLMDQPAPLVGGYPAVFGLVGAFTWLLWVRALATGENPLRAFGLIIMLLLIRLIFGTLFGGNLTWIAEFVGFAFGFGISFAVSPGGRRRILARLRRR